MERGRRNRDHQNKLKSYYMNFQANERVERERERERAKGTSVDWSYIPLAERGVWGSSNGALARMAISKHSLWLSSLARSRGVWPALSFRSKLAPDLTRTLTLITQPKMAALWAAV